MGGASGARIRGCRRPEGNPDILFLRHWLLPVWTVVGRRLRPDQGLPAAGSDPAAVRRRSAVPPAVSDLPAAGWWRRRRWRRWRWRTPGQVPQAVGLMAVPRSAARG